MEKDSFYFQHDSDAISDPKILSMIADYGIAGFGMYWIVLGQMRTQLDYLLEYNSNTFKALNMQAQKEIDSEKYINDCIKEYKLFSLDESNTKFYSESFIRRMKPWDSFRKSASEAGKKSGEVRRKKRDQLKEDNKRTLNDVQTLNKPPLNNTNQNNTNKNNTNQNEKEDKELIELFEKARKIFPGTVRGFDAEFNDFKSKHKDYKAIIPLLVPAIQEEIEYRAYMKKNDQWIENWKNYKSWLYNSYWTREFRAIDKPTAKDNNMPCM